MKIKILKEAEETMPIGQMRGDPQETMPLPGRGNDETREDEKSSPEEMSTGQVQSVLDKHKSRNYPIDVHLKAAGFENVSYIASGQFGAVYAADHPSGREMAVKAIDKVDKGYDRELNAYSTIGKARQESEIIAKHFPLIYTIDTDSHDRYAFIVMERLTDEGPYADIIKDIFSGGEYLVHARGDLMARGAWKDLSNRIKTYFNNDKARNKIIDTVFEGTPEDYRTELKAWATSWQSWRQIGHADRYSDTAKQLIASIEGYIGDAQSGIDAQDVSELTKALRSGYYYDALEVMRNELDDLKDPSQGTSYRRDMILQKFYKRFYPRLFKSGIWMDQMVDEYLLYNDRDALQDEFGGMKREFEEEPWMAYFVLEALRRLKEYRPTETDPVWQDTSKGKNVQDYYWRFTTSIISGWVNFIRKQAPIGIHHKPEPERQDRGGAPEEVGDAYEEARDIRRALDELERMTGLAARDLHDKNVMMRPIDGAIVIVDVGMFKSREDIEKAIYKKLMETKSELREEFYQQTTNFNFNFDDFRPKTGLHPSFWQKDKLFDKISRKLKQVAKEFAEDIEIDTILDDILLVGSLASYNWHKKSDIDVHLVIDFDKVNKDEDLVEEMMRLYRMRWNDDHQIMIYGHEVEIYVQDVSHKGHYAGIYSLVSDEWLKKPKKEDPEVDFAAISNKAASIANEINEIDRLYKKKYHSEAYDQATNLKKKLREMRQVGLDGEGMYSVENLVFKVLRNNGFINKLSKIRENAYDFMHSIGETAGITLTITNNLEEKKKKRKKRKKAKVSYSRNPRSKGGYKGKTHWGVGGWWYNGTSGDSGGDGGGDGGGGE